MAYGVIYLLIDGTNDFEYVGKTTRPVEVRFKEHTYSEKQFISNAIRAHGVENFVIVILKECESEEELDFWERHFIKSRDTMFPNGYNFTEGGEGGVPSDEARAKMSAKRKGRPLSPEHCANISAGLKGKEFSPERCANIAASLRGKKHTAEHCAKISATLKGRNFSPEHCAKIAAKLKGIPKSPEHRVKASISKRHSSPYKNLLKELDKRQLTYTAFAKLMNLSVTTISEKMRGKVNFTENDKEKLAEIFGKPIEYLLERNED